MRKVMLIAVLAIAVMLVASLSPAAGVNAELEPNRERSGDDFDTNPGSDLDRTKYKLRIKVGQAFAEA